MKLKRAGKAFAKINISLDIVSKMDDGYHYLETIMQTVDFGDEITVECESTAAQDVKIAVTAGIAYLPGGERNIAGKAARGFARYTGIMGYGIDIRIDKKIPVCAGLGGGSADAACVLRLLNDIFETGLAREELEKIALSVGADVPFCVTGGTKLARGRGEILTCLPPLPQCDIVICKPPYAYSTPELFSRVDCKKIRIRPDTQGIVNAIERGDLRGAAQRMYNVFEDVVFQGADEIGAIKSAMLDCGALGTVMTGSGPTVIGLFDDEQKAQAAHGQLAQTYKDCTLTAVRGQEQPRCR